MNVDSRDPIEQAPELAAIVAGCRRVAGMRLQVSSNDQYLHRLFLEFELRPSIFVGRSSKL